MKKEVLPNKAGRNVLAPKASEAKQYPILAYDVETDSDGNFTYATSTASDTGGSEAERLLKR